MAPHHFNPALVHFLKSAAAASDRGCPAAIVAEATEADVTEVEVDESSEADSGQR